MKSNMKPNEYSLTLNGFKTKAQVEEFINWYNGQGEQDAAYWFEESCQKGKIDVDFMPVNSSKPYVWSGNNLTAYLEI